MTLSHPLCTASAAMFLAAAAATLTVGLAAQIAPMVMDTARVTIAGTSNVHNYSAWTDTVRVTGVKPAATVNADTFLDDVVKPGALASFEVAIPAATLTARDPETVLSVPPT